MGLDNRGYMHDEPSFMGGFSVSSNRLIWSLIIANVALFLFKNVPPDYVTLWLGLSGDTILMGQVWRLITYGFCHADLLHIFFNMFSLFVFGRMIIQQMAEREFLSFYLVSIVASGLVQIAWAPHAPTVGASGATSALLCLAAMRYPTSKVLAMGIIPIEIRFLAIGLLVISFLSMGSSGGNTAHAAHLGGALFGIGYQYFHWNISNFLGRFSSLQSIKKTFRRKPNLKIHSPEAVSKKQEKLDEEVDRILAKIHEEGEAALTSKERKTLEKASKKYRQVNK